MHYLRLVEIHLDLHVIAFFVRSVLVFELLEPFVYFVIARPIYISKLT